MEDQALGQLILSVHEPIRARRGRLGGPYPPSPDSIPMLRNYGFGPAGVCMYDPPRTMTQSVDRRPFHPHGKQDSIVDHGGGVALPGGGLRRGRDWCLPVGAVAGLQGTWWMPARPDTWCAALCGLPR